MKTNKYVAALITILAISAGLTDAGGLFDIPLPHKAETTEYRPGSLNEGEALALYSAKQRQNSFEACADQFPDGKPIDLAQVPATLKPLALCSDTFAVLYSQTSKAPVVVVERLTPGRLRDAKGEERTNEFYADPRIPAAGRAELSDFRGQQPAVDRGHMSPAADAPDQQAMAQSFALSNMVAQDPTSNRKTWNKVEQDTRKYARRASGNVFVFSGPLFDEGHATVGGNRVWKPTRLFKLVYDETTGRAWAFVLPNRAAPLSRPMDYATFVKTTGLELLEGRRVTGTIAAS